MQGQRDEEGVFAADPIAHPAEHEGAQRPDQEAGREQCDGAQQRRNRMRLFEEFHRQDRGEAAENVENVEVVPLDDVAPRRGGDHASKVRRNVSGHGCSPEVGLGADVRTRCTKAIGEPGVRSRCTWANGNKPRILYDFTSAFFVPDIITCCQPRMSSCCSC
jgi:hypothetical protein